MKLSKKKTLKTMDGTATLKIGGNMERNVPVFVDVDERENVCGVEMRGYYTPARRGPGFENHDIFTAREIVSVEF